MWIIKLYFTRHGQTQWNVEGRIQGQLDSPLTRLGQEQAFKLAAQVSSFGFQKIVSSDLGRAKETALVISTHCRLAIQTDTRLRERFFGLLQGQVPEADPALAFEYQQRFSSHNKGVLGGESIAQLLQRWRSFLLSIASDSLLGPILIITHGEFLQILNQHLSETNKTSLPEHCQLQMYPLSQLLSVFLPHLKEAR